MTDRDRSFMLDKSGITLDDKPLSAYGVFCTSDGYSIDGVDASTSFQDVPGVSGGIDASLTNSQGAAYLGRRTVTVNVGAVGDPQQIEEAKIRVGALLGQTVNVGGLVTFGYFKGRMTAGEWTDQTDPAGTTKWASCELSFDCDPFVYGPKERVELTFGSGSASDPEPDDVRFRVKGNRPTPPVIYLNSASISAGSEIVLHANGNYMSTFTVPEKMSLYGSIDCENHLMMAYPNRGDVPYFIPPTIDSDYFDLIPGYDRLSFRKASSEDIFGFGYGYLEYTPRYAI